MTSGSIADVTERLFLEFEPRLPLTTIVAVVRGCRHELDTAPGPALPELVERLARQRSDGLSHEASGSRDEDRNESRSCRPTDVGEYTSTYLLRACAEVAQQTAMLLRGSSRP